MTTGRDVDGIRQCWRGIGREESVDQFTLEWTETRFPAARSISPPLAGLLGVIKRPVFVESNGVRLDSTVCVKSPGALRATVKVPVTSG